MKTVDIQAHIVQREKETDFTMVSTLDKLIAREMHAALSRELDRAVEELKKRVMKEIEPYEAQLDVEIARFERELEKRLGTNIKNLELEMSNVTGKEDDIKEKIDEMTKGLGRKALDKLLKW